MLRPGFPSRPPGGIGMLPSIQRPPMPGIPGVRPILPPVVRPALPTVTPAEKPQTTVYVGKIAPTVDNDFMLYLLQLCGPVKNWKRAQDPTGTPRGFGFCEFESAEGVLRALRLLSKFNIDGQELVLNVNQATREFLERFVKNKTENSEKLNDSQAEGDEKGGQSTVDKTVVPNSGVDPKAGDSSSGNKESNTANFGVVTDEDKEADRMALEKLTSMIEERLKTNPLPPPPPLAPGDRTGNSISEPPAKSRDGDPDVDMTRNDASDEKNDEETTSDNKAENEQDRPGTSSPEKSRKPDKSRERDRERDVKQEKEREIERYERETERERIRKEREQRRKLEDAERKFEECLKDWEYREREKQKQRQYEKDREKDRKTKRKKDVINEEDDEEEDSRKRWRRNAWEDKRKRRQREKEDDMADRLREEEEIAEANRRAEEEKQLQKLRDALKASSDHFTDEREKADLAEESCVESKDMGIKQESDTGSGHENHIGDGTLQNGNTGYDSAMTAEPQQSGSAAAKKLGFGLVGSGKRTSVPSVFEEEDDAHKDKKMRPLVPIDYSTEELQAVEPAASGQAPSNLAAAAEFAKRISTVGVKEEKYDAEKERNRRANDRSSHRDRDRNDDDSNRTRDENKEKTSDRDTEREHGRDKPRTTNNKKLMDAKQLIDTIPKTKEELFSYEINWAIYDKHALHERMKPWISRKITEFLGEEEATLVDYIVSSTQEHVGAERMLQLLQSILDEEAEMFVLKMWRMLIFEIKKVETGLPSKTRS
ncbi:RNA-binding motif protein 25 isoform X2 [Argentina anserina]|nr:RNA-binding motif protein 25 isoform X2 [Potentilla anserina]XP_050375051.1 RNA-binding motif protein 25 isoform X2 [Potentilla anserina]XP_050375052.1 RNA-binding motif protein 25 isoform X2 [Potentilla anserina]